MTGKLFVVSGERRHEYTTITYGMEASRCGVERLFAKVSFNRIGNMRRASPRAREGRPGQETWLWVVREKRGLSIARIAETSAYRWHYRSDFEAARRGAARSHCPRHADEESNREPEGRYSMTPRTLSMKLETSISTREWLLTLLDEADQDEKDEISHLILIIGAFVLDADRVEHKRKLSESEYYHVRTVQTLACITLEEHMADNADLLANWDYSQIPTDACSLLATVLCDITDHFAGALLGGRAKNFQPLLDDDIRGLYHALGGN
jgi:hypothetical protein